MSGYLSAWVWLSDRSMRVIQPKYQDKSGQSVPGPNIVKMLSVDNVPIAFSDSGLMYRVQEDDQLELMGTTQAWVKLHWASLAVDLNTLASHYAAAASITLDGFSGQYLVPNRLHERASPPIDAPLSKAVRAWYDVIANQFMIAPAELQQTNLLYVGSDGQRGGWLYDRELGQLSHSDLVTPTLARLFIDESLQSKVVNWQVARHVLDGQFVSDAVRREDGRVLATSAEGIVFLIDAEELGVAGQGPLLLGVNAIWCQAHQATLHHDLEQLCIRYASMGKIYVMNQDTSGAAQFWSCTSNRFAA
ncbi:MAG: hypothetical protein IT497_06950 [Ottowia sp.]|nr:hypothetical protein [Ottowia sp.]